MSWNFRKGVKFIMYFMFLVSRNLLVRNFSFCIHSLLWMIKDNSHLFQKSFEDKGEKIEEQDNQGILGAMEESTE